MVTVLDIELSLTGSQFVINIVETSAQKREVFRLRHQVSCVERGHQDLPGDIGEEFDKFDDHSRHVLLRRRDDGEAVGTARLICMDPVNPDASFQIQEFCAPALLAHLPLRTSGEISRFALSKSRRIGCVDVAMMRLALVRGLVQLSSEMGVTHWLALQERSLIRLNERNGIHFDPIGPPVRCHGIRQPTYVDLAEMLDGVRQEQFETWAFLTAGGAWVGRRTRTVGQAMDTRSLAREGILVDAMR
jgi:N-acyl-L-homoserine lactone synthetase